MTTKIGSSCSSLSIDCWRATFGPSLGFWIRTFVCIPDESCQSLSDFLEFEGTSRRSSSFGVVWRDWVGLLRLWYWEHPPVQSLGEGPRLGRQGPTSCRHTLLRWCSDPSSWLPISCWTPPSDFGMLTCRRTRPWYLLVVQKAWHSQRCHATPAQPLPTEQPSCPTSPCDFSSWAFASTRRQTNRVAFAAVKAS